MALKLDNQIKRCTSKNAGHVGREYVFNPLPDGADTAYFTVQIAGGTYQRSHDKPVLVYDGNQGNPSIVEQMTVGDFVANYDFED